MAKKKSNNNKKGANLKEIPFVVLLSVATLLVGFVGAAFIFNSQAERGTTGNGAPSGAHYNLNVIGVPKGKTGDFTGGNRIFVPLEGTCRVDLSQGDFSVIDGNCSDGSRAAFSLPNPDPDGDGVTAYSVYARPLGKPGGSSKATTCGVDPLTLEEICSLESTAFVRGKGKSSFDNVSKGFLTVLVDTDGDATTAPVRLSIFDPTLENYFWQYDNNGMRNLQLRFYPQATNVN